MHRALLLAALAFLAVSCGGSKTSSTATSVTAAATSTTVQSASPRADARVAVVRCRTAFGRLRIGAVVKADLETVRATVAKVKAACDDAATLKALADANLSDSGIRQAADAEAAVADGLVNFGFYLRHVADGTSGQKIFAFSVEELRQAKILLDDALSELT